MPEVPDRNRAECTDFHQQQGGPAKAVLSQNHTHNGEGQKAPLEPPGPITLLRQVPEHVTLGCVQMGLNFSRGDSTASIM